MATSSIDAALPATCNAVVPPKDSSIESVLSRWSLADINLPHATVTPTTTADVIATIGYASAHGLKIVPASGGHGTFVPVTARTIYLSMRKFTSIKLDEGKSEVTIGGGCLAGEVLKHLAAKGWYTAVPNSNAVGMVGALLGGMNYSLVGKHGVGIDCIKSISVVPFSTADGGETEEITVSLASTGQDRQLFDALRGAGHGLGVVTSIVLKSWPISELGMTGKSNRGNFPTNVTNHRLDNRIWTRTLIFPPPAVDIVARTFLSLFPPKPELNPAIVFARAPPSAPKPGAPMMIFSLTYFGSKEDAERICAVTFEEDVVSKAVNAMTVPTEFAAMNDKLDAMNRHGGIKEYHTATLKEIDESSIKKAFDTWLKYTETAMATRASSAVLITSAVSKPLEDAKDAMFFSSRDRNVLVQALPWYASTSDKAEADAFGQSVLQAVRESDEKASVEKRGFANNMLARQDMHEIYTKEQMADLTALKGIWDRKSLGWSPVVDGW